MKSFNTVLFESIFVGALLVVLYTLVEYITKNLLKFTNIPSFVLLFLSGALFHLICEYTGINVWYVREYNKLLI
jgi:hypothetical protein